jgi:ribosomal protein L44E
MEHEYMREKEMIFTLLCLLYSTFTYMYRQDERMNGGIGVQAKKDTDGLKRVTKVKLKFSLKQFLQAKKST